MKKIEPRWARIQELFNQAADMPRHERQAFLTKECGDDASLRLELEELLAADAGPPSGPESGIRASVLTQALSLSLDRVDKDRRSELLGTMIGPYRLSSVLGHGGAGTVYLGERSDRQYSARVAVKVLDHALHDEVAHRFRAERQILANLNHPNIAKLFDAGETHNNQPYLVMEYVHGDPIDYFCDAQRVSIKQRLKLFIKVCEAVQYAHQNLVVHRDLKPGNILVTPDSNPKLLDFGIAKLLDSAANKVALPSDSQPLTRMNDRVLTPEYASPEQILGQNVTTTSDVYALGVILFELLTGNRPYSVNVMSQLELERIICIIDPPLPSQMIKQIADGKHPKIKIGSVLQARGGMSAMRLQRELQGDIDAIIMRALRKEPDRRYNSVEQFVDDIERYLKNAPVLARQGNWLYYSRRFVTRHWIGVSTSAFIIITLASVAFILSIQNERIKEQRDLAQQENQRAESVSNFMLEVFSSSDPFESQGRQITAKELLDRAGSRINDDLTQQPEVRARLMSAIGRAYQRQSQPEVALKYLQDALQLLKHQAKTSPILIGLTLDAIANAQRDAGNYAEANRALDEALNLLKTHNQANTATYLQLLTDKAWVAMREGKIALNEELLNEALALAKQLYGNTNPETGLIISGLSQAKAWSGQISEALQLARESIAIVHATLPENHPDRLSIELVMAQLIVSYGNIEEALPMVQEVLRRSRLLFGENNIKLARPLDLLATIMKRKGQYAESEKYLREALRVTALSVGDNNNMTADLRTALAEVKIRNHDYLAAESELNKALVFLRSSANHNQLYLASAEYMLALSYSYRGRWHDAAELLKGNIYRWQNTNSSSAFAVRSQHLLAFINWQRHHDAASRDALLSTYSALSKKDSGATEQMLTDARARMRQVFGPAWDDQRH